jgi:flagellar motor switch protein FliM
MNPIPHDFRKPRRLDSSWHQRLSSWFRIAVALLNKTWAKQLPFAADASFEEVDVCFAHQGPAALPEGTCGYRVMIGDDRLPTFLTLPRPLLLRLVESLLGEKEPAENARDFTPIEENLAEYFLIEHWLPSFRETWPAAEVPAVRLHPREANPQCSRLFAPTESLIQITFQLRAGGGEGLGAWYFHRRALIELVGGPIEAAPPEIAPNVLAARREAVVTSLPIHLQIVLGSTDLSLTQLARLKVGDVLLLDRRADERIIAQAGGRELFQGKAGRHGSRKAFQIEGFEKT